ncbi:MAG: prolipoprotein diacylglyceryl transferase [bacterium]|nr:prolipoprotein diacylglyceryl transferase [bacterium]
MWPSFSFFGLFDIYFFNIFLVLAAFLGSFIFWRRLHQNANYKEFIIFDIFLLSIFLGFVGGRFIFILLNWPRFGWNVLSWFDMIHYPGIAVIFAIAIAGFSCKLQLAKQKIAKLEIMDYWAQATCFGLIFYSMGLFFAGEHSGYLTNSFLGINFPGLAMKNHPLQLYNAVFYLGLYIYLNYLEKNYRTYNWYRGNRSSADTGFLVGVFLFASGLYSLITLTLGPAQFYWYNFSLDWIIYLLVTFIGGSILLQHSAHAIHRKN